MSDPGPKCEGMLQNYNAANGLKVDGSKVLPIYRVRNLKFATYLKFATCENTNKINELW